MTESIAFDRAADFYDETRGFPPGVAPQVGALFRDAGNLTPESRVIEVGVGTGRIALPLGAHVGMVAGIDLARPMLKRLITKRTTEPVFPVEGNAARLPFPDNTFDAAVGVHVFHLIPGWQDVLREIARVLKPDGVLLQGWHGDRRSNDELWAAWNAAVGSRAPHNVGVPREAYDTFLPDQGWRQIGQTHTYAYTRTITPAEFISRLERRVWSSMWRLDDEVAARGIAAVRAAMHEYGIDPQQPRETAASFNVTVYAPPGR
jgi:ubiquinone/menaquinone biosynthesis C-methylase UbiE